MSRSVTLFAIVLAMAAGCSNSPSAPLKAIATSPDGHPRVMPIAPVGPTPAPAALVAPVAFEAPVAAIPLPPPIKPYSEWSEQEAAADALGRIGTAAVPSLVEALHSPDPAIRQKAAEVLGRMGPDAKDAVPHLVRLLDDPDEHVRKTVTRTIGRIGPPAQDAVPALVRTLLQPKP